MHRRARRLGGRQHDRPQGSGRIYRHGRRVRRRPDQRGPCIRGHQRRCRVSQGGSGLMPPVVVVAVANDDTRVAVVDALERRYGADYDVIGVAAVSALRDLVETLTHDGRVAALTVVPIDWAGDPALATVTECFPTARRIALLAVGDTSAATILTRALTLNTVDYYFGHPWATPEEELYPV